MKREILGLDKNVTKKRAAEQKGSGRTAEKKAREEAFVRKYNVSDVSLPGEETGEVPVYDRCDEVRRKIRGCLRDGNMTRAAFFREISKTLRERAGDKSRTLQGVSLASFLAKSGPREGRTNLVFYAAYVFFEKLRIRNGVPKSQFLEEMEIVWPDGFDTKSSTSTKYICSRGYYIGCDEYGCLRTVPC